MTRQGLIAISLIETAIIEERTDRTEAILIAPVHVLRRNISETETDRDHQPAAEADTTIQEEAAREEITIDGVNAKAISYFLLG